MQLQRILLPLLKHGEVALPCRCCRSTLLRSLRRCHVQPPLQGPWAIGGTENFGLCQEGGACCFHVTPDLFGLCLAPQTCQTLQYALVTQLDVTFQLNKVIQHDKMKRVKLIQVNMVQISFVMHHLLHPQEAQAIAMRRMGYSSLQMRMGTCVSWRRTFQDPSTSLAG